ncbi:MAG TPA: hypothetical protein VHV55_27755 [Pirellulales bacterium]|jgi:hypothetical protein|nr:hypothetical protein [Pirellulales bacterium]
MPVQFYCPHCRQLLKVGRRKIGTLVACPRCGSPTVVPTAQSGATPLAEESVAGFEDVNELLRQPPVAPQFATANIPTANMPAAIGWSPAGFQPGALSPRAMSVDSDALDLLVVSRAAIYAQAVIFLVVACVAFLAGYWVGQSRAPATASKSASAPPKAEPVRLAGNITFNDSMGKPSADAGAVIIALPIQPPSAKLKAKGLRPEDPLDAAHEDAVSRVKAAGGDYARANNQGAYDLVVPAPGNYYVLIISQHATRPANTHVPDADLKLLSPYFEVVTDLLGPHRYSVAKQRLSGRPTLPHAF